MPKISFYLAVGDFLTYLYRYQNITQMPEMSLLFLFAEHVPADLLNFIRCKICPSTVF